MVVQAGVEAVQKQKTPSGIEFLRTPSMCFQQLPDYPFEEHFVTNGDGLRVHYVDEGPRDGPVVLVLEGQPSWSYGSRKLVAPLTAGGCRVILQDFVGMGKSDKPVDESMHTFEQHVHWLLQFIEALGLRDITLVMTDWGGNFGFRLLADRQHLFARVVAANAMMNMIPKQAKKLMGRPKPLTVNTDDKRSIVQAIEDAGNAGFGLVKLLPTLLQRMVRVRAWIAYTRTSSGFRPSGVVKEGWLSSQPDHHLSDAEAAAFDAPFPTEDYMVAPRTWPTMFQKVVQTRWYFDAEMGQCAAWERLKAYERPLLFLGGDLDAATLGSAENQQLVARHIPGAREMPHERFPKAHHFILDDHGVEVADRILKLINATPRAAEGAVGEDHPLPPLSR